MKNPRSLIILLFIALFFAASCSHRQENIKAAKEDIYMAYGLSQAAIQVYNNYLTDYEIGLEWYNPDTRKMDVVGVRCESKSDVQKHTLDLLKQRNVLSLIKEELEKASNLLQSEENVGCLRQSITNVCEIIALLKTVPSTSNLLDDASIYEKRFIQHFGESDKLFPSTKIDTTKNPDWAKIVELFLYPQH